MYIDIFSEYSLNCVHWQYDIVAIYVNNYLWFEQIDPKVAFPRRPNANSLQPKVSTIVICCFIITETCRRTMLLA